jgi:hypothetical protein
MARLLLAVMDGKDRLGDILSHHEVTYAETLNSALQLTKTGTFDAIICGFAFDESRMFDFLNAAIADAKLSGVPFICCRVRDSELINSMFGNLKLSCQLLGAEFVDFHTLKKEGRESEFIEFIEKSIEAHVDRHL